MAFTSLKKLIKKKLENQSLQQGVTASKIKNSAQEVIKEEFPGWSDQIEVLEYNEGELVLKVKKSGLAQELKLKQEQIANKINDQIKKGKVKNLSFRTK